MTYKYSKLLNAEVEFSNPIYKIIGSNENFDLLSKNYRLTFINYISKISANYNLIIRNMILNIPVDLSNYNDLDLSVPYGISEEIHDILHLKDKYVVYTNLFAEVDKKNIKKYCKNIKKEKIIVIQEFKEPFRNLLLEYLSKITLQKYNTYDKSDIIKCMENINYKLDDGLTSLCETTNEHITSYVFV